MGQRGRSLLGKVRGTEWVESREFGEDGGGCLGALNQLVQTLGTV